MAVITNLARNPSAETNTADWSAWGTGITLAQDATHPAVGSQGIKVTHSGTNASGSQLTVPDSGIGQVRVAQASVWAPSGINLRIGLWGYYSDASNAQIGSYSVFAGNNAQQIVPAAGTSDAVKTLVTIRVLVILNGAQSAGDFWVDAVMLEAGSVASTYFDGSTANGGGFVYAWAGTPHASASTRTQELSIPPRLNKMNVRTNALLRR